MSRQFTVIVLCLSAALPLVAATGLYAQNSQVEQLIQESRDLVEFQPGEALLPAEKAVDLSMKSRDSTALIESLFYRGYCLIRLKQYDKATIDLLKAHGMAQETGNYTFQAYCEYGFAMLAAHVGDRSTWEQMIRQAYSTAIRFVPVDEPYGRISKSIPGSLFSNLASSLIQLNDLEAAEEIIDKLLPVSREMEHDRNFYPWNLLVKGELQERRDDTDDAEELYSRALLIYQENDSEYGAMLAHQKLGRLFKKKGHIEPAFDQITRAARLAERLDRPLDQLDCLTTLAELHEEKGEFEEANEILKQVIEQAGERFEQNMAYRTQTEQIKASLMEKENEILRQEKEHQQKELAQNQTMLATAGSALIAVVLLGLILLRLHLKRMADKKSLVLSHQRLEKANEELKIFNYSVSHDLRNPINNIIDYSFMFLDRYSHEMEEDKKHLINRISTNALRTRDLIDDLLVLSRASTQELHLQTVNLTKLATGILESRAEQFHDKRLDFTIEPGMEIYADYRFIRILMENLLDNAIKYSSSRDLIKVSVNEQNTEHGVTYCISDNGVGFEQEKADDIFSAFVRLHDERLYQGTGIGLAIARQIVARHGGTIWAESSPGEGTTVCFALATAD